MLQTSCYYFFMPFYENYESFRVWLLGELEHRKWSGAMLARKSNLTRSHISRILSGERMPGVNALVAIAHAFSIPEEVVLRHAGKIATQRKEVDGQVELVEIYVKMNTENRNRILDIARLFAEKYSHNGD